MAAQVHDVIVVGAGLSGLQAALDVQTAGRSVLVLEARDRVGGKTNSVERPDGKGLQELGATWLNDTNQSHVWSYCQQFGLTPVVQNFGGLIASEDEQGHCHLFPADGMPEFAKEDVDNIVQIRQMVEEASLNPDNFQSPQRAVIDALTLEQWLRNLGAGPKALLTARVWCRGTLGQDPNEVSALAFLEVARGGLGIINLRYDGKHGAQNLRLKEGTQAISIGMSKLLPTQSILLNTPVSHITRQKEGSYTVQTVSGEFAARKVILSIPSPAYKDITFSSPLPALKQIYINSARYGCIVKYICLFKTPFWRDVGACGLAQSFRGPMNHCRDTSVDEEENYALTCFMLSGPGRRWLALDEDGRRESVLRQISSLFGIDYDKVNSEYLDSMTSKWMEDKRAGWGCPFVVPPPETLGIFEDGQLASMKYDGLYFVGTEFTDEWRGYMDGALRSGKRGASQALEDLASDEK